MEKAESTSTILWFFLWFLSIILVGGVAFYLGANTKNKTANVDHTAEITPIPTQAVSATVAPTQVVDLDTACAVTGPSQKKDYLISYLLKEGDSFQSIAEKELGDASRVSEITKLNEDQRNLTVGSTIYLPPKNITDSSGNISEVSGRIIKKDTASWQLSYGGGEKGPGLWMPGFWFKDFADAADYKIGDCVTILFDNGVKVYSIKKSS